MKIYSFTFQINKNLNKIQIFTEYFFNKYNNICKIIYKNKLYPLKSIISIVKKNKNILKIKLIFSDDIILFNKELQALTEFTDDKEKLCFFLLSFIFEDLELLKDFDSIKNMKI